MPFTSHVGRIQVRSTIEYPASPLHQALPNRHLRRALMGLAMGLTATSIIYSRWGQRSGAHMNPATTLSFLRLGKVMPWDAAFYITAQFVGGVCGVWLSRLLLGTLIAHPSVSYVATVPGPAGAGIAFLAEGLEQPVLDLGDRRERPRSVGFDHELGARLATAQLQRGEEGIAAGLRHRAGARAAHADRRQPGAAGPALPR